MQIVSPTNEINYGSYDNGLDWNLDSKKLSKCVRVNAFTPQIQAELEFLCSNNTLRILLIGYDLERDLYLEKTWLLSQKQFGWDGSPVEYQILGKALGLELDFHCISNGRLELHFRYFDQYQLEFASSLNHRPLRNVNPYSIDEWSYVEKHAMLACSHLELMLEGHSYGPQEFNLAYEWFGGQLPKTTKELRSSFWQSDAKRNAAENSAQKLAKPPKSPKASTSGLFATEMNLKQQMSPHEQNSKQMRMAGSLLMMGHDNCSSESAVWVEDKVRYRLPRIIPSYSRSISASLLPDLEWKIRAGEHFELSFYPFGLSEAPKLVFPHTKMQRIYGLFYGKLLNEIRTVMPIQAALGFIDYREIQWRK